MNSYARFCLAIAVSLTLPMPAWAIVTSDTPGSHVVAPGEPAYGINLDGVALLGFDTPDSSSIDDIILTCSGSLISNRHVLTAAHCFDQDYDGEVDFLFTGVPIGNLEFPFVAAFELVDRSIVLGVRTDTIRFAPDWPNQLSDSQPFQWSDRRSDLAVFELVADVPADVPRYSLYGAADEDGRTVVLTGYGATGHGSSGVDDSVEDKAVKRAGLNRFEVIRDGELLAYDFDSGLPENNPLAFLESELDLGFGADEVITAPGDSGAPSFVEGAIAGVHSSTGRLAASDVTNRLDNSWGEVGYDARVSNYRSFLVEATDGQVVFVPEPSTGMLLLFGVAFLMGWQQTKQSPGKTRNTPRNR